MNFWLPLSVSLLLGVEVLRVKAFSGFSCFESFFFFPGMTVGNRS